MSYLLSYSFITYSLLFLSRIYHYISVIAFCWWCLKGKTNICRQASIEGDISIWITHWRLADIDVKQIHQILYICTIDMLIWCRSLLNLCFCFSHHFHDKIPSKFYLRMSMICFYIIIKHHPALHFVRQSLLSITILWLRAIRILEIGVWANIKLNLQSRACYVNFVQIVACQSWYCVLYDCAQWSALLLLFPAPDWCLTQGPNMLANTFLRWISPTQSTNACIKWIFQLPFNYALHWRL